VGEDAIQEYKVIGDIERYQKVEEIIREWKLAQQGDNYIIPLEKLATEQMNLKREIEEYQNELETLKNDYQKEKENIGNKLKLLENQRQTLENEILQLRDQINRLHSESVSLQQRIDSQDQIIKQNQPVLLFFRVMPQLTETPLWIEVLRLALLQGEMDELVWHALNRLVEINLETELPEFQELILRGAESDFDIHPTLIKTYSPFVVELKRISEILQNDPLYAANQLCTAWEKMLRGTNEGVLD